MSTYSCGKLWPRVCGTVASKICHTSPDSRLLTRHGVSCGAMENQLAFDSVIIISEEDTVYTSQAWGVAVVAGVSWFPTNNCMSHSW